MSANSFQFLWSDTNLNELVEPKRKNHFLLQIGQSSNIENSNKPTGFYANKDFSLDSKTAGVVWYAKSLDKPKLKLTTYDYENNKYYNPLDISTSGLRVTTGDMYEWDEINVTIIDPSYPSVTRKLLSIIDNSLLRDSKTGRTQGLKRSNNLAKAVTGEIKIFQYTPDAKGSLKLTEEWTLYGCDIVSYDFGGLEYSSGDLLEINITISFMTAKCVMYAIGNDKQETFFAYAEEEYMEYLIANQIITLPEEPTEPTAQAGGQTQTQPTPKPKKGSTKSRASLKSIPSGATPASPPPVGATVTRGEATVQGASNITIQLGDDTYTLTSESDRGLALEEYNKIVSNRGNKQDAHDAAIEILKNRNIIEPK